jgi:hypothetical protein
MYEQKTKPTEVSVEEYLERVPDPQQREDAFTLLKMMKKITGQKPRMWGPSMIGFGEQHFTYDSGHEGDCFYMGFAPRKGQFSLYFMPGVERFAAHLKKLGKHKTGKACLYVKRLADVDLEVLRDMLEIAHEEMAPPRSMKRKSKTAK